MKSFKEYLEAQEINENAGETITKVVANTLGYGTLGVFSAWVLSLLFKLGATSIKNFAMAIKQNKEIFSSNIKKIAAESNAVKHELQKSREVKSKYEEELSDVLEALKNKEFDNASETFKNLPFEKKKNPEINRFIIEEIIRACGQIPVSSPTPGNQSYQVIKKFTNLATAKQIAETFQKEALKYALEKDGD